MRFIGVYARIYAQCIVKALASILKNPWTLLLPMGLIGASGILMRIVPPLNIGGVISIGGLILGLIFDALGSCYLYFVGEVVANTRVSLSEFRKSVGAYFWSIMNFVFVLWIANLVLETLLATSRNGDVVLLGFSILVSIPLNAVPEVLYQKGTLGGLATINRSLQFIHENWIEWFFPNAVPNLIFAALGWWSLTGAPFALISARGLASTAVIGAAFHAWMVFRGQLFQVLDGTTHRQRMYRYRTGT